MKKITTLLTLVLLMIMFITTPVLAGNGNGNGGGGGGRHGGNGGDGNGQQNFVMVGIITGVENNSITVQTVNARFDGQEITVNVTGNTSILQWTETGKVAIIFDALKAGDTVHVKGTLKDEKYTATKVTIDIPLSCQQ
jgi:hypothetical protein